MTGSISDRPEQKPRQATDWRLLPLTLGMYAACLFSAAAPTELLTLLWPVCAVAATVLSVLALRWQLGGPGWLTLLPRLKNVVLHLGLLLIFLVPVFWSQATAKGHWDSAGLGSGFRAGQILKAQLQITQQLQKRTNRFGATSYQAPAEIIAVNNHGGEPNELKTPWPVWLSADRPNPAPAGSVLSGIVRVDPAGDFSRIQAYAKLQGPVTIIAEAAPDVFSRLRDRLQDLAHRHLTGFPVVDASPEQERGRALIASMIVGDTSRHDERLREDMKTAGLSHLSAVSGANCALVFGVVTAVMRRFGLPRWSQVSASLGALVFFVLVVGTEPSVLRAAVMGVVGAIAVFSGRGRKTMPLLFVACILLLSVDPWYATDLAFQLSVAATWGIVVWGKALSEALPRWLPRGVSQALAVAIAAQFATIPVLGPATGSIPTHSVLANLIVTPLVPLVTLLGTAALPFLLWFPELAALMLYPVGWLTLAVGVVGQHSAGLPLALLPWPEGILGYLLGLAVLLTFGFTTQLLTRGLRNAKGRPSMPRIIRYGSCSNWLRTQTQGSAPLWWLVLFTVGALLAGGWLLRPHGMPRDWSVAACDVGQGDMFVLNIGDGAAVVIDAGPDPDSARRCLDRLQVSTVERMFISHQHTDHYAGLEGVLTGREVNAITYGTAQDSLSFTTEDKAAELAQPGQEWTFPAAGSTDPTIHIRVLGAEQGPGVTENNASAVLHVRFEPSGTSMLFTGDLEQEGFAALERANRLPDRVHVLKMAHHGARNGGTRAVRLLQPDIAVISVGKDNDYGHPHPDILAALTQTGARVLRTDELGSLWIRFSRDGFSTGRF